MPDLPQTCITYLPHPTSDLGANFFFTRYLSERGTIFSDYHAWLTELYSSNQPDGLFRAVVQAVGLTGLSNTCYAPDIAFRAQEHYSQALAALKGVLNDPVLARSDMALLAITLLMLLEMLNFKTWERYQCWTAHINAGLALLELRGPEQFTRQRGTQLYMQIRSQILLACVQQQVAVPKALVQATYYFQLGTVRQHWRKIDVASPASITEISFRVVNLRAALRTGAITDLEAIRTFAMDIDDDLETWRTGLAPSWRYSSTVTPEAHCGDCFNGLRHVYPTLWIAEAWNNWRMLRLLVNQMLMQNPVDSSETTKKQNDIRQLSTDVCLTVYNFAENPSILSLIQPLYVIALETLNTIDLRAFAVRQLRAIDASMGVRQASLLADTAAKTFDGSSTESRGT
ncbi:hypothetical protein LTR99_006868 [Exophiala xenobiotica]|uniref:Transcription factor domain-containing protein n=1 Tax=Vermiconidia calcicola TaxID=1690605 RepID=A0AAV9PYS8_9PEZI|nr:hypothetical protein LTR72_006867 [Exophiala xenobiotica]KAK5531864.1 hypothetical protein LTR25_008194 [Vermiconidia calcicola]KAK5537307.1 hypothetical protein LTR23_007518 [Chaetothyriales sp. CCFEE 6169]KAK5269434.1 hypothetical protein LTR96_005130 [Exophiala xenobiotica]KAK5287127.1 hypothetical protein LTR14_009544 [Exophiala xenobiotica]